MRSWLLSKISFNKFLYCDANIMNPLYHFWKCQFPSNLYRHTYLEYIGSKDGMSSWLKCYSFVSILINGHKHKHWTWIRRQNILFWFQFNTVQCSSCQHNLVFKWNYCSSKLSSLLPGPIVHTTTDLFNTPLHKLMSSSWMNVKGGRK